MVEVMRCNKLALDSLVTVLKTVLSIVAPEHGLVINRKLVLATAIEQLDSMPFLKTNMPRRDHNNQCH
jgi:hypothetical protein